MDIYSRYTYTLRKILLVVILINIVSQYREVPLELFAYFGLFSMLVVNDYLRYRYLNNNKYVYLALLVLSMTGGRILGYYAGGYIDIYFYTLLYEIILFFEGTECTILLIYHGMLYLSIWVTRAYNVDTIAFFSTEHFVEASMSLLFYALIIMFFFSIKYQVRERRKVLNLNKELQGAYDKLHDYSKKVEELTISKERSRVAQEIHDSIGHTLTAVIMHLDFIEKLIDKDSERAKELIIKTQGLARNSMNEVRMAVYALKEDNSKSFIDSLLALKDNLTISEGVNVDIDVDPILNKISPNRKQAVYRTIQEGLTNSIKHGKATEIKVKASVEGNLLYLDISDNGIGCKNIVKGNGLMGIEDRIASLDGEVQYCSRERGFQVNLSMDLGGNI